MARSEGSAARDYLIAKQNKRDAAAKKATKTAKKIAAGKKKIDAKRKAKAHPLKGKPKSAAHRKAISEGLKKHHASKKKWIKDAIKHPGALKAKAKKAGLVNKQGKITKTGIKKLEKSKNPTTRKEAQLADTLSKFHKGKKKAA